MKALLALALLCPAFASAADTSCPIRSGALEGVASISVEANSAGDVTSVRSNLSLADQDIPALRNQCTARVGGYLCVHQDADGARYEVLVNGITRGTNLVVRLGVLAWRNDSVLAFEVKRDCDPFSKWE